MKKILVLLSLTICVSASAQMSITNSLYNPSVTVGFGKNLQTHNTLEFANVTLPINQTISASVVAVRFGADHTPAYGGGTLNAGFNWNAPLIGLVRPSLGTGALYSQHTFSSYTEFNTDKIFILTKNISLGIGGGIGYMPSAQGFDALVGISLHGSF